MPGGVSVEASRRDQNKATSFVLCTLETIARENHVRLCVCALLRVMR